VKIEVVYGDNQQQILMNLTVAEGSSIAIALQQLPDLQWDNNAIGIFGSGVSLDRVLEDGDRIEIYRPLKIDPKVARKARVKPLRRKH